MQEKQETEARCKHLEAELKRIEKLKRRLLDNIGPGNREMVNQRLAEIQQDQQQIHAELAACDDADDVAHQKQEQLKQAWAFAQCVESTLHHGMAQDVQAMLRRIVQSAEITGYDDGVKLNLVAFEGSAPVAIAVAKRW